MRRRARGQALLEASLSILVVVTVLLVGLHLSDVGFLSMKVHEAAAASAWDATAYRVHYFSTQPTEAERHDATGAIGRANQHGATQYADYDGRRSRIGAAPALGLTRASPIQVQCSAADPGFRVGPSSPYVGAPQAVSCSAAGAVSIFGIPAEFLQRAGSGFFETGHHPYAGTVPMCSTGRGAGCAGRVELWLGDYGLSTGVESADCAVESSGVAPPSRCQNAPFYLLSKRLFDGQMQRDHGWRGGWTDRPEAWIASIVGEDPPGRREAITGFYMSYRGSSANFLETSGGERWEAQPYERGRPSSGQAHRERRDCTVRSSSYCFGGRFPTR